MQTCHTKENVGSNWRWKEENCQNTKFISFFWQWTNWNYVSVHSDFVTIFTHLSSISENTNKQKTRKKNVYDGDQKSWFIDIQTTGDNLNETGRQMRKLRNGQMGNTNIKHLLKMIKISHIPLNISTFYRST